MKQQQEWCGICGHLPQASDDDESRWLLHHLRHQGMCRRLCTNCVLKISVGSFCPICLHVYDEGRSPPPHARVMCFKCSSVAHSSCAAVTTPPPRFTCSTCSHPNFVFFKLRHDHHDGGVNKRFIDEDSAKALVAAAKLASISMTKAAMLARIEAERKVKDAVLAKNRAREALQRLLYLATKEREIIDNPIQNPNQIMEEG